MPPASLIVEEHSTGVQHISPADAAKRMFQRVLCAWASDVLSLRARGLTTPKVDPQHLDQQDLVPTSCRSNSRARKPARTRTISPARHHHPIIIR